MTNQEAIRILNEQRNKFMDEWVDFCGVNESYNMAIQALKEQEAVEPIPPNDESDLWRCGNCNHQLFRCTHQRYCEMCGHEVKWE